MEATPTIQAQRATGSSRPPANPPSSNKSVTSTPATGSCTTTTTQKAPIVQMLIGGTTYLVNIRKIPYLLAMAQFQAQAQASSAFLGHQNGQMLLPVHEGEIPFFEIINFAVSHGYRHFFRFMPTDLAAFRTLCRTLDYLRVDVLDGQELHNIAREMEEGVTGWIKLGHLRGGGGGGLQDEVALLAERMGDPAFRLLYLIVTGRVEGGRVSSGERLWSEEGRENPAFRPTRMVMVNVRLWDQATKRMLLLAYQDRFGVSNELQMCYDFAVGQWKKLLGK